MSGAPGQLSGLPQELDTELRERLADAAYRQSIGGLPMTALAVAGLVAVHGLSTGEWLSPAWLAAMALTLLVRVGVLLYDRARGADWPADRRWRLFVGPLLVIAVPSCSFSDHLGS